MTWQHFLKTLALALLGAAVLAMASQARAEGGDGSSVIPPQEAEAFLSTAASEKAAEEAAAAEPEEAKDTAAKKSGKLAKGADKKKPNEVASAKAKAEKPEALTEAAAQPEEEPGAEQSAAPAEPSLAIKILPRQSDAARSLALKPLISRYASENGLPYELADAVVRLESRYNPAARRGPNLGLTQINFQTAQSLGYQGAAAGLLDAETNLRYGLKYLAKAYQLAGGDTCGAILRFQFGHRTQTMNNASRAYCAKVKVIAAAAE